MRDTLISVIPSRCYPGEFVKYHFIINGLEKSNTNNIEFGINSPKQFLGTKCHVTKSEQIRYITERRAQKPRRNKGGASCNSFTPISLLTGQKKSSAFLGHKGPIKPCVLYHFSVVAQKRVIPFWRGASLR